MNKQSVSHILSSVLLGSVIFSASPPVLAASYKHSSPTMEQTEKKVYKTAQSKIKIQTLFPGTIPARFLRLFTQDRLKQLG